MLPDRCQLLRKISAIKKIRVPCLCDGSCTPLSLTFIVMTLIVRLIFILFNKKSVCSCKNYFISSFTVRRICITFYVCVHLPNKLGFIELIRELVDL